MPAQPLYFHSCSYYADLAVTLGLIDILEAPVPDDPSVASDFDLWLHQAVFPLSQTVDNGWETFNQV